MKKPFLLFLSALLILLLLYCTLTPFGSLRFALVVRGYFGAALTLETLDIPNRMMLTENQIPYSLENPPVETDTQAELVNWVVTRHGIFYIADYYGWG